MAKSIPITINGITYPSILQAAIALEMPRAITGLNIGN